MKTLTRDAREFVDEIAKYVHEDPKGKAVSPRVAATLGRVTAAAKKERVAHVATVVALSASEKTALATMLAAILSHKVECHFTIDETLLGGMKVQVADWVVDTSLSTQLATLTHTLL